MSYFIGVDQGGSGTRAVVCSLDGKILGAGNGPGACHVFSGMEAAMAATHIAVSAALSASGRSKGTALVFAGGYTGADWDDEYILLRQAVEQLGLAKQVVIVNDSIAALRGGTQKAYGAILVAGTGANCAVLAPDGRTFIYHYYHDSNLQGGAALGQSALNAIFRAKTGRPPQTSLRERVLKLFNLNSVDSLMRSIVEGKISHNRIPEIAPLVFEEVENGDQAAQKIVWDFASGCAELLTNGLQRLGMTQLDVDMVLSGGIFKAKSSLLRERLREKIIETVPNARFIEARYEPVVGAALIALEKIEGSLDERIQRNIEASARKLSLVRV